MSPGLHPPSLAQMPAEGSPSLWSRGRLSPLHSCSNKPNCHLIMPVVRPERSFKMNDV